jgi:D-alanyl-D-alanine carboxypeptidase
MARTALFLFMCLSACDSAFAADFQPKVCTSAVEYVGGARHPAMAAAVFAGLDQPLVGDLDRPLVRKLNEAVGWILKKTSAPGITAAVGIPGQGLWSTSRGLAVSLPPTPLAERPYFHWASAGKTFTAAIVMQLIDEGKLADHDPLAKWFPKFPNAGAITIDHLLTHTNGIFSFNADVKFQKAKGYHSPDQLIRIAARHGCVCCPGERWYYSNTGYVLIGRIIEQIEGRPLHEVVQSRIIKPLGLTQTIAFSPDRPPKELAVGHIGGKPDRDFEPTTPFGAGNIGASARDMVLFWQSFLGGRIVRQQTVVRAYSQLYPMFERGMFYGRGVMLTEFADKNDEKVVWLGHSGGTPGLKAVIAYDLESRIFLAVAINGDVSAEAAANTLRKVVKAHRAAR